MRPDECDEPFAGDSDVDSCSLTFNVIFSILLEFPNTNYPIKMILFFKYLKTKIVPFLMIKWLFKEKAHIYK